jgi:hypothetical protein
LVRDSEQTEHCLSLEVEQPVDYDPWPDSSEAEQFMESQIQEVWHLAESDYLLRGSSPKFGTLHQVCQRAQTTFRREGS